MLVHSQRTQPVVEGQKLAVEECMLHNPHKLYNFVSIAGAAPPPAELAVVELSAAMPGSAAEHKQLVEHMQK